MVVTDLVVRVTREQLVALGACEEGLAIFDELVPSGTFFTKDAAALEAASAKIRDTSESYAEWLGPLCCVDGDGYGYGYGYGSGYGDGSGDGDGDGDGSGSR